MVLTCEKFKDGDRYIDGDTLYICSDYSLLYTSRYIRNLDGTLSMSGWHICGDIDVKVSVMIYNGDIYRGWSISGKYNNTNIDYKYKKKVNSVVDIETALDWRRRRLCAE